MPTTPINITGSLNLGGAPQGLQGGFRDSYQSMLNAASQTYSNTMAGYQQALGKQQQRQAEVSQGYRDLEGRVMSTLAGVEAPQRQAIADLYAQEVGQGMQGMAAAGLGNTTVTQSMRRGVLADRVKRENELTGQMAQLYAGTQSQLGSQALGYDAQAIRDNASLASAQLGFMGQFGLQAGQSLAGLYAQSQQQKLAQDQFDRDAIQDMGTVGFTNQGMTSVRQTQYYDPRTGRTFFKITG